MYNEHKRIHALKFQSAVLPDGLIGYMYGPVGKNLYIYRLGNLFGDNLKSLYSVVRKYNITDVLVLCFVSKERKHDASILRDSGFLRYLEQFAFSRNGQPMCVYGDAVH